MSDPNEFSVSAVNRKRSEAASQPLPATAPAHGPQPGPLPVVASDGGLPFDPLRVLGAVVARWRVVVLAGVVLGAIGFGLGLGGLRTKYTASAQLMKVDPVNAFRASEVGDPFRPRQLPVPAMINLVKSLPVVERVVKNVKPPVSPRALLGGLVLTPERNSEMIQLQLTTTLGERPTADLLNLFGAEVIRLTREMQVQEASEMNKFLQTQVRKVDQDLAQLNSELLAYAKEAQLISADKEIDADLHKLGEFDLKYESMRLDYETTDLKIQGLLKELAQHSPGLAKLQLARDQLAALLNQYTTANPLVQRQQAQVAALEKELQTTADQPLAPPQPGQGNVADSLYIELFSLKAQKDVFAKQLEQLKAVREGISQNLSRLPEKSLQYARIKVRQQSLESAQALLVSRQREAQLFEDSGQGGYRFFEAKPQDVQISSRRTKLLALAGGGGFLGLVVAALLFGLRESFDEHLKTSADLRRVTRLPVLAMLPDMAAWDADQLAAWALRTWTAIQSQLTPGPGPGTICGIVSAGPGEGRSTWVTLLADAAGRRAAKVVAVTNRPPAEGGGRTLAEALANPADVVRAGSPVWLVTGADWQWTADQRRQWSIAMTQWAERDAAVVLVELLPARRSETLLLAESFPNLIWLAGTGQARGGETSELLNTFRHGRCRLVGAVLNREVKLRIPFISGWLTLLALGWLATTGLAAEPGTLSAGTLSADSIWHQPLTLGAGDVLNFSFYGRPELNRTDVTIGPDGRITYLQVENILAAGLTIDELREKLNAVLARDYQQARVIVTPVAFHSKKVYLLGKVVNKGAYELDRPLTIVEAVALAGGLETGLFELNTVELADLPRSFLARRGRRIPVDFEKLFLNGDLTQNAVMEPDDYLYFPSSGNNEIYLLGSVHTPGSQGLTTHASVLSAIALGAGFLPSAFKQRVLVVRGSLTKPRTFVVDTAAILAGQQKDFPLEPRDIVYVSDKPWARVEELLDQAATAFIQSFISVGAGAHIAPLITRPVWK